MNGWQQRINQKAVDTWGIETQIYMLVEECAELIQAACKIANRGNKSEHMENFLEEIADVEVMIGQMKCMFNGEIIEEIKLRKLKKLELKLKNLEEIK